MLLPPRLEWNAAVIEALTCMPVVATDVVYKLNIYPPLAIWVEYVAEHGGDHLPSVLSSLAEWGTRRLGFMLRMYVSSVLREMWHRIESVAYPPEAQVAWGACASGKRVRTMIRVAARAEELGNAFAMDAKLDFQHLCKVIYEQELSRRLCVQQLHRIDGVVIALTSAFVKLFEDANCAHYATDTPMDLDDAALRDLMLLAGYVLDAGC